MPNQITNIVQSTSEALDVVADGDEVDFNKVIPMPMILRNRSGQSDINAWAKVAAGVASLQASNLMRSLFDPSKDGPIGWSDEEFDEYLIQIRALRETGFAFSNDWATEHWGTSWNASEVERLSATVLKFETAWAHPKKLFLAWSKMVDEPILVEYADEEFAPNCGRVTYLAGQARRSWKPKGAAARNLAASVLYPDGLPGYMRRTAAGDIEYIDEDDEDERWQPVEGRRTDG